MIFISFFYYWFMLSSHLTTTGSLEIQMNNVESKEGMIRFAIFDQEEGFRDQEHPFYDDVVSVKGTDNLSITVSDLPFGHYTIGTFHDLNNNGVLDRNTLGIPNEPYAFSNNPTAKWKAPKFKESRFHFTKDQQVVMLELKHWRDR